jgi:tetratricopeptide (TPR) repeat protein
VWEKALTYLRQAGVKAVARSANREAVSYFEQALVALGHRPESRETLEQAVDLRLDRLGILLRLGELTRMGASLDDAERRALALGDAGRIGWIQFFRSRHHYTSGRSADALRAAQRAVASTRSPDDTGLAVAAEYALGLAAIMTGDYQLALVCFTNVLGALEGTANRPEVRPRAVTVVLARAWLVMVHAVTGDFDAGIRLGTDTIGTVEETVEPLALSQVYVWLGDLYRVKGDFAEALRLVEHGIDIARRADLSMHVADELHHLGIAYAEAGEIAKGRALIEQSQREAAALGFGAFESLRIVRLGTAALRAGDLDEARALAERACALARTAGERGHEAQALHLLGSAMSQRASTGDRDPLDLDAAERHFP